MSNDRNNNDQVIDLTESEDLPVNPLYQPGPPRRRNRRHEGPSRNEDNDIEVVSVMHNERPLRRLRQRKRELQRRRPSTEDDLDVVEEKRLTPQERLRRVQEQHARGEVVQTGHRSERYGFPLPPFGALHAVRGGLIAPQGFHPYLRAPQTDMQGFNFLGHRLPFGLFGGAFGNNQNLEQSIIERTLEASMSETDYTKRLDVNSLMLPPPPQEAKPGFTRSLAADANLVCIKCGNPLGKARSSISSAARSQSSKIFVRGCGHVYCGDCTFSMKDRSNKDKACPISDCKKIPPKKRSLFREVFL